MAATTESTSTDQAPEERSESWTSYFEAKDWVAYVLIVVLGLIFRWTLLDMRPYHHDESLHGMYGRYFYDWPNNNFYKYDPMLHGPMLYNCMRFIYAMFGDSLWAARTPVAIMGSLFIFVPFLFRSFFKRSTVLLLTAAVALSPTLVYWSRFLREDYWVVSGMLICIYGITLAPQPLRAALFLIGLTIQWCTKENIFVTLAIVLGYLLLDLWRSLGTASTIKRSLIGRMVSYIERHPWETLWSLVVCALIYSWFFSAGFRYPQGIIDGLGGRSISYWYEHHEKERIQGPFNFHLYMLGWYELPFFIAFLTHIVLFYRRASAAILMAAAVAMLALLVSLAFKGGSSLNDIALWRFFKLKDSYDMIGLFVLLFHAPLVTFQHLLRNEEKLALTGYLFTASLFTYSYLGEKVPWLTTYPFIFGLPYLALFFEDYFKKHPIDYRSYPVEKALLSAGGLLMILGLIFIFEQEPGVFQKLLWPGDGDPFSDPSMRENLGFLAVGILLPMIGLPLSWDSSLGRFNVGLALSLAFIAFNTRATIQTNFLYAGKETEYISQVHTTYELAEAAQRIVDTTLFERDNYRPKVLVDGEATWPLTWYFRQLKEEYKFSAKEDEKANFTYIFQDWKDDPSERAIPEGFYARKLKLRGWWVPDFRQMTLKRFLAFSINHYPWSPSGFAYTTLLVNKDTDKFIVAE